jgi:hypothetical protein
MLTNEKQYSTEAVMAADQDYDERKLSANPGREEDDLEEEDELEDDDELIDEELDDVDEDEIGGESEEDDVTGNADLEDDIPTLDEEDLEENDLTDDEADEIEWEDLNK